ncbi:MAG TPA: alkaline phosphatase family protein, partial [Candidatus Dormibacteraeota bacterium]|nr:alkaline phosphatase family protein [Candidatus Dormibacteraeota bacterium]
MAGTFGRRRFLAGAAAATALGAIEPWSAVRALAAGRLALPNPKTAPFDHVIVLMMENRSFDHFLGWLPGADGIQSGLAYWDTSKPAKLYPTYQLAPDYQGCGYADPDHSWEGGVKQLNGGKMDGFLQTALPNDTLPVGYYSEDSLPVLGALARSYTTSDYYFCSILAETFPNRFYQHAATTDRDHNMGVTSTTLSPTIWDRVAAAGLTGLYYSADVPFIGLWGTKYASITRTTANFLADCAAGNLPNLAFVDPSFEDEGTGTSVDDHPHADIRAGEAFIGQIYQAVRSSRQWNKTVMVLNYDEWGGFYDHVVPPKVIDTTTRPVGSGPHPDYRQLGFRVPNVIISPFSTKGRVVHNDGFGPFEHTSVLKMVEWRWGLSPLTDRDKNARNLAEMLDFNLQRTDTPTIPTVIPPPRLPCLVAGLPANPPKPISIASGGDAKAGSAGANNGTGTLPDTAAAGPVNSGAAPLAAGLGLAALAGARPLMAARGIPSAGGG